MFAKTKNSLKRETEADIMIKCASLFSQILSVILDGAIFDRLVIEHDSDRGAKGFTSRMQLVSMMFCHLARADSLREIVTGLRLCSGKLLHLGIKSAPRRSTLAYANCHRDASLYEDFFWKLLTQFRSMKMLGQNGKKFRFKNKLYLLDSTTISLCLSIFPWADYRQAKGGVKVHVLLDQNDYMPAFINITEAKVHDSKMSCLLNPPRGSIIAMDRGYYDVRLFSAWNSSGVYFVTRMKNNIVYTITDDRGAPEKTNVISDHAIKLTGQKAQKEYSGELRLVTVWNAQKQEEIKLMTNDFEHGASTIGKIYKERWQIELFFKTLKQTLNVKTFIGTTVNALRIQIWTAMISLLVIKWLHYLSSGKLSLSVMSTMLRMNLFTYRLLADWLNDPNEAPPKEPLYEQMSLFPC